MVTGSRLHLLVSFSSSDGILSEYTKKTAFKVSPSVGIGLLLLMLDIYLSDRQKSLTPFPSRDKPLFVPLLTILALDETSRNVNWNTPSRYENKTANAIPSTSMHTAPAENLSLAKKSLVRSRSRLDLNTID